MQFKPQLAKTTRSLLENRPRSMTIDHIVEGTGLTKAWITDFLGNPDRDHGVNKVETLHFFLSGGTIGNDDNK